MCPVVIKGNGLWVGWPGIHSKEPLGAIPESDPSDQTPTAGLRSDQVRNNFNRHRFESNSVNQWRLTTKSIRTINQNYLVVTRFNHRHLTAFAGSRSYRNWKTLTDKRIFAFLHTPIVVNHWLPVTIIDDAKTKKNIDLQTKKQKKHMNVVRNWFGNYGEDELCHLGTSFIRATHIHSYP